MVHDFGRGYPTDLTFVTRAEAKQCRLNPWLISRGDPDLDQLSSAPGTPEEGHASAGHV